MFTRRRTTKERIEAFLSASNDKAFLRSELDQFGSRAAVGRALCVLVREGKIWRIAYGAYALVPGPEPMAKWRARVEGLLEALTKLGYEPTYGGWEWREYLAGRTNGQIPMRATISVNRRMRRRTGIFGRFEYQTYGYWRKRERVPVRDRVIDRAFETKGEIYLRSDFYGCASKSAINRVLREDMLGSFFSKLARGVYASYYLVKFKPGEAVMQALRRLEADPQPGSVPDRIRVSRRVGFRKIGYGDTWFTLEYANPPRRMS